MGCAARTVQFIVREAMLDTDPKTVCRNWYIHGSIPWGGTERGEKMKLPTQFEIDIYWHLQVTAIEERKAP